MPLHKKEYRLNRLTGQFCDDNREQLYRRSIQKGEKGEFSFALSIAAGVFAIFAISDYYLLGLTTEFYLLLAMRGSQRFKATTFTRYLVCTLVYKFSL